MGCLREHKTVQNNGDYGTVIQFTFTPTSSPLFQLKLRSHRSDAQPVQKVPTELNGRYTCRIGTALRLAEGA